MAASSQKHTTINTSVQNHRPKICGVRISWRDSRLYQACKPDNLGWSVLLVPKVQIKRGTQLLSNGIQMIKEISPISILSIYNRCLTSSLGTKEEPIICMPVDLGIQLSPPVRLPESHASPGVSPDPRTNTSPAGYPRFGHPLLRLAPVTAFCRAIVQSAMQCRQSSIIRSGASASRTYLSMEIASFLQLQKVFKSFSNFFYLKKKKK